MIDMAIALYAISVLTVLSEIAKAILFLTMITSILWLFISAVITDGFRYVDTNLVKIILKYGKQYMFFIVLPMLVAYIAIPSERTMYMIAGLYASDKIINTVADSEIAKQAERTLLAKLQELEKEYLVEEEKNE